MHLAHEISMLIESRAPSYGDSDDEEDGEPSDYTHNYPVSRQRNHDRFHNGDLSNGITKPTMPLLALDRPKFSLLKASSKKIQKYAFACLKKFSTHCPLTSIYESHMHLYLCCFQKWY